MWLHTLVYDNAWNFLFCGRAAGDAIALDQTVHLCQVLKGAVDPRGKFWHIMGLQDELLVRKGTIQLHKKKAITDRTYVYTPTLKLERVVLCDCMSNQKLNSQCLHTKLVSAISWCRSKSAAMYIFSYICDLRKRRKSAHFTHGKSQRNCRHQDISENTRVQPFHKYPSWRVASCAAKSGHWTGGHISPKFPGGKCPDTSRDFAQLSVSPHWL